MSLLSTLVTSDLLVICLRVIVPGIIPRIIVIIVVTTTMAVSTFISGFTSSISMDTRTSQRVVSFLFPNESHHSAWLGGGIGMCITT